MKTMPQIFAYTIETKTAEFDACMNYALTLFRTRFGRQPVAVWLHPSRVGGHWPPAWPPVFTNEKLNRNIIGLEISESPPDLPAQLRLI